MRIYATRRECEIILNALYSKMSTLTLDELNEYNTITARIMKVTVSQCKRDNTRYEKLEDKE